MREFFEFVWICLLSVASLAACRESATGASGPLTASCEGHLCPCTEAGIRGAIQAGGDEPYTFDCDGPQTVVTRATVEIDNDVILDGDGDLTVAGDADSVFRVASDASAELRGFGIGTTGSPEGGQNGIQIAGTLVLDACTVSGFGGAGISNGFFPETSGDLELINSSVSGNDVGILNLPFGTVRLVNSTVSDNTEEGIVNALEGLVEVTNSIVSGNNVGIRSEAALTLANTTVSGNTGGGIVSGTVDPEGGDTAGTLTLTNSNVSENGGGGIANISGFLTATNSTVSENEGPGIRNASWAVLTSITVSGNVEEGIVTAGKDTVTLLRQSLIDDECSGDTPIASNGYNAESPGNTCALGQATDLVDVTEMQLNLGPLQNNGGLTETHEPGGGDFGPGSIVIDWIPQASCVEGADQRGQPRPETGGSMCDVGSFEVQ